MFQLERATEYAGAHGPHALLAMRDSDVLFEEYASGWDSQRVHALYSGTKSFWSIAAAAAAEDGLLDLDEPVARSIPSWNEGAKARVRIEDLLGLISGLPFGGLGAGVPTFEDAIAKPLAHEARTTFTYSGIPLQVFGGVLSKKLASQALTPLEYLKARIVDPIGLRIGSWRKLKDGTETMPTGAFLAAREWAKFGQLLVQRGIWEGTRIIEESSITACWRPGTVNPRYGLGFWLYQPGETDFVAYSSGAGGQGLYIIPSQGVVVVHFGQSKSYNHERFLRRLLPT